MASFNEALFEKKLFTLKDTQESISNLSSWCLQQPQNHKKIVQIWLQVLKKVKIEQRLLLFYLANDVIQYSKRKGYEFVKSWGTSLQRATTMVRGDDKVRTKVLRLFTIWDERSIYDESFLVDLVGLLSSRTPAQTSVPDAQDFQPATLISKIRTCKQLEDDTDMRLKIVNENHLQLSDVDALRCSLKDRRHGEDVIAEVEEGIEQMEMYIKALDNELKDRTELIDLLDLADVFYETQRGEARIVCNAYRNFGTRVKSLKRKLDDLIPTLASPVPSPDINAPSPSPESDLDLPDDDMDEDDDVEEEDDEDVVPEDILGNSMGMGMTSFIGSMVLPDSIPPEPYVPPQPPPQIHHSVLEEVPVEPSPEHHYQPTPQVAAQPSPVAPVMPPSLQHQSVMPPLLGEGIDFPINGGESFLNHTEENGSPIPPFLGTGLSFIGNSSFQFDFSDESLLQDLPDELETPVSPSPEQQREDSIEEYSPATPKEGKPIEVISSTPKENSGFSLSEFLKTLMPSQDLNQSLQSIDSRQVPSTDTSLVEPPISIDTTVPPPPLEEPFPEKLWNSTLPPKFPSWGDSETSWEEEAQPQPNYKEPFGFDVRGPGRHNNVQDMDMRVLPKAKDIDHRNLISLTGSPCNDNVNTWQQQHQHQQLPCSDMDYRKIPLPDNRDMDIVESVDMEMSDDEDLQSQPTMNNTSNVISVVPIEKPVKPKPHAQAPPPHHTNMTTNNIDLNISLDNNSNSGNNANPGTGPSVSFNIATASRLLGESPLKESEEPKKKLSLPRLLNNVSPPRQKIPPVVLPNISLPPPSIPPLRLENSVPPDFAEPPPRLPNITVSPSKTIVDCTELLLPSLAPPLPTTSLNRAEELIEDFTDDIDAAAAIQDDVRSPDEEPETSETLFSNESMVGKVTGTPLVQGPVPPLIPGLDTDLMLIDRGSIENPDVPEAMPGPNFSDSDLNIQNEGEEEPAVNLPIKEMPWIRPLMSTPPPPPPPLPNPPPHSGFRPRMHSPMWRGPRRGRYPRMRPMGPVQPGNGNFQPPMSPRPPFRGNWRPRFTSW